MSLPWHPLAEIFPMIEGDDYAGLVADVRENGLRDPIIVYDGMVLDGRNRARACDDAGVSPRYEAFSGNAEQALSLVLAKNLHRRHLKDNQRAYIAAKLAGCGRGGDRSKPPIGGLTVKDAADRLKVAERTVERARIIRDHAAAELDELVERGEFPIALAAQIAERPEAEQIDIVAAARGATGPIARAALAVMKRRRRDDREADLAGRQQALPSKRYGTILADPEWRFAVRSRETGMDRAADNHYPTSATEVIAARPVASIADDDCALFLWATVPMLPQALEVMKAWGFEYRSHWCWQKDRIGTGYWNRNRHELLLLGIRGDVPAPAPGTQWDSCLSAPVGAHSVKPDWQYDLIEAYFPHLPKIELNARRARPGWDCWGYEAPVDGDGQPVAHDPDTGEITTLSTETSDTTGEPAMPSVAGPGADLRAHPAPGLHSEEVLDLPDFLRRGSAECEAWRGGREP